MFARISRYLKLPDAQIEDAQGRLITSKTLRLLPEVTGEFNHTILETDRLDTLAAQHYREPRKWWRICDANPDFLSPLALLGTEVLVTIIVPVTYSSAQSQTSDQPKTPPWHLIVNHLASMAGVEKVSITDSPQDDIDPAQRSTNEYHGEVTITYNVMNVEISTLSKLINETPGYASATPVVLTRTGKKIIIPSNLIG